MYAFIGWSKRVALAALLLSLFYVVADHNANKDRISLGGVNNAWTFGAAPSNGAGAEVCTYFSPAPTAFTSQQLGQVRCDSNQLLMVDVPGSVTLGAGSAAIGTVTLGAGSASVGSVTPLLPFNSTADGQSGAANSGVNLVSYNGNAIGGATTFDRVKGYQGSLISAWANNRAIITSSGAVTCTNISSSPGYLVEVINALAAVQGSTIDFFDDSGTGCATGARIYEVTLSSSASPILMIPLQHGLAYTTAGAISANVVATYLK